jgi:hypothetical protein
MVVGVGGDQMHRVPKCSTRWLCINVIKRNKYLADKELIHKNYNLLSSFKKL